jgi:serpin B
MMESSVLFDRRAEFSKIGDTTKINIRITKFLHKSFIEVNENGTEADAASAVVMQFFPIGIKQRSTEPIEFICDRSFLFLIHDKEFENIFFLGKYVNPNDTDIFKN